MHALLEVEDAAERAAGARNIGEMLARRAGGAVFDAGVAEAAREEGAVAWGLVRAAAASAGGP